MVLLYSTIDIQGGDNSWDNSQSVLYQVLVPVVASKLASY